MFFRSSTCFRVFSRFRRFSTNVEEVCVEYSQDFKIEKLSGEDTGIVVFGLNRYKGKNSLNRTLIKHLSDAFDVAYFDKSYRVIILRSYIPGVFCAGADLKERINMTPIAVNQFVCTLGDLMFKIENTPIPVIAAIDGFALGGGLEMGLACDIRIISKSSKIGLVETKLAIMPGAGGTQRLSRIIGPSLAKELIFTSRILDGTTAKEYGIVNHCIPDNLHNDAAYQKSLEMAREILPNGPIGIKMSKLAINKGLQVDINQGCSIESLCYSQVINTKDRIEGLKAFNEKRTPNYIGE